MSTDNAFVTFLVRNHTPAVPSSVYGTSLSARCSALLSMEDFSFSESSIMATIFSNLVGAGNRLDQDVQLSLLDHGPPHRRTAPAPCAQAWPRRSGRPGLPCLPAGHLPVKGDHISHMYGHHVAFPDLIRLYQDLLPVPLQPDLFDIQGHAPRQVPHGFFMGPLFQKPLPPPAGT